MQNNELTNLRTAIYCRKSQDAEDKQVLSIPAQLEEADRFLESYKLLFRENYTESKSAKLPDRRPIFSKMMTDIKTSQCNTIFCWKLDRLARNMEEGGEIIHLLQSEVIKAIITPHKVYLPSENALLMALEFASANQFSRDLSVNVKRGQRAKAQRGIPHGLAALGFKNDRSEEKGNRKWLVDEDRFPLVKDLFDKFLTGTWSAGKLAKYAREELKLTTQKHKKIGGALVTRSRVHALLKDTMYAGYFFYGGERYELDITLPRIITEAQHEKILRILSSKNIPKVKSHTLTYTGYIQSPDGKFIGQDTKFQVICDCKHKFSYMNKEACPKCHKLIEDIDNPKYLEYKYYYNVSRKKAGEKARTVSEDIVQEYFTKFFKENLEIAPPFVEWSKKYLYELKDKDVELNRAKFAQKKIKGENATRRKQKILQLMADEQITPEDGRSALDELNKAITSSKHSEPEINWFDQAIDIADLISEFVETMNSDSVTAKRELLSRLGSNLLWNEEKLSIVNTKWVDALIDGVNEARLEMARFEPKNNLAVYRKTDDFTSVCPSLLRG